METTIDATGRFVFDKVLPGAYTARLVQGPLGSTTASIAVKPGTRETAAVILSVRPQIPLTGRVLLSDSIALSRFTMVLSGPFGVILFVFPMPPILDSNGADGLSLVSIRPDGAFAATLPEGAYRMTSLTPPDGYRVKSISSEATDLLLQPLQVKTDATLVEIRVVLEPDVENGKP